MHVSAILFGVNNLSQSEVQGKRVLDVGSYDWNGNYYGFMQHLSPSEFIGVDMQAGPGVDVVCCAEDVVEKFGRESFDIVVSSELMEHTRNWREVISNIKNVCKPDGIILITTRSKGFGLHGYPHDYWRYELDDMEQIFSDCEILKLEKDPKMPGVFIKVKRPNNFVENDLAEVELYSMIQGKRIKNLDPQVEAQFLRRCARREKLLNIEKKIRLGFYHLGHLLFFRRGSK